ncbi:hypothetical protein PYS58_11100 [Chryseobacterium indologenes]|uniref:hypothetical protein n=1 Tax=Chryseobacterium indologenes TaxID=253 RepID=UPI0023E8C6A5|nr:hypothetical protein [Chryseobacterium indologenes]WET51668.1 hypothetical protein PYS58_11100 [Chryseobacterium indologenes]
MKKKISYWFLMGLAAWAVIVLLRKNGVFIPIINNHFTDFMAIPMYCYFIEYIMNSWLGFHWRPDFKFVLTSILYLSFLFEVLGPELSHLFTGDIWDVLSYFLGAMLYYFFKIR